MKCKFCKLELTKQKSTYCSNRCQKQFEYKIYIESWLAGHVDGNRGKKTKNFSAHIIKYLHIKFNNRCVICGWAELNPVTGNSPLEIDHIDGNSLNNSEANLQLLCPNCHSLTKNYKNLNKGKGRVWRREKYVKIV